MARVETWRAALRYELARDGLGVEFLAAVDDAVRLVAERPRAWPRWEGTRFEARTFAMARFPYVVAFVVREELVVVLAVAHTSRRPGYWLGRARR